MLVCGGPWRGRRRVVTLVAAEFVRGWVGGGRWSGPSPLFRTWASLVTSSFGPDVGSMYVGFVIFALLLVVI